MKPATTQTRIMVDWTSCDGRGLCAELLPELVDRDEWGFPLIADPIVPASLRDHTRRGRRGVSKTRAAVLEHLERLAATYRAALSRDPGGAWCVVPACGSRHSGATAAKTPGAPRRGAGGRPCVLAHRIA
jgi:ferredoxin